VTTGTLRIKRAEMTIGGRVNAIGKTTKTVVKVAQRIPEYKTKTNGGMLMGDGVVKILKMIKLIRDGAKTKLIQAGAKMMDGVTVKRIKLRMDGARVKLIKLMGAGMMEEEANGIKVVVTIEIVAAVVDEGPDEAAEPEDEVALSAVKKVTCRGSVLVEVAAWVEDEVALSVVKKVSLFYLLYKYLELLIILQRPHVKGVPQWRQRRWTWSRWWKRRGWRRRTRLL
jgi:hypothetical protein